MKQQKKSIIIQNVERDGDLSVFLNQTIKYFLQVLFVGVN